MQILVDGSLYTITFDLSKYKLVKNKIETQLRFYAINNDEYSQLLSSVISDLDDLYISVIALDYDSEQLHVKILEDMGELVIMGKRKIGDLIIINNN